MGVGVPSLNGRYTTEVPLLSKLVDLIKRVWGWILGRSLPAENCHAQNRTPRLARAGHC